MAKQVSSFNAKTHLSSLLNQVQQGQEFIITKHNQAIAKLAPIKNISDDKSVSNIITEIQKSRKAFSLNLPDGINTLKSEGRK